MKELNEKILREGKILPGNVVKVDSFINHQIDVKFIDKIGLEFFNLYKGEKISKVLTIETSGIPIAIAVAKLFDCRVVFAKKGKSKNLLDDFYEVEVKSYTRGDIYKVHVAKEFLNERDVVLIIDDFLANGAALTGLIEIVKMAKAKLVGCGVVIEKGFQPGGKKLRDSGIRVESLAIIDKMDEINQTIEFRGD